MDKTSIRYKLTVWTLRHPRYTDILMALIGLLFIIAILLLVFKYSREFATTTIVASTQELVVPPKWKMVEQQALSGTEKCILFERINNSNIQMVSCFEFKNGAWVFVTAF